MEKSYRNSEPKASPRLFFYFDIQPKKTIASFKKVNFIFSFQPSPF